MVWVYRERLKERGLVDKLFSALLIQIDAAGFSARKGQIVDAAIVPVPRQRNTLTRLGIQQGGSVRIRPVHQGLTKILWPVITPQCRWFSTPLNDLL